MFMPEFLQTYLFACVKYISWECLDFCYYMKNIYFFQLVFYIKRTQGIWSFVIKTKYIYISIYFLPLSVLLHISQDSEYLL